LYANHTCKITLNTFATSIVVFSVQTNLHNVPAFFSWVQQNYYKFNIVLILAFDFMHSHNDLFYYFLICFFCFSFLIISNCLLFLISGSLIFEFQKKIDLSTFFSFTAYKTFLTVFNATVLLRCRFFCRIFDIPFFWLWLTYNSFLIQYGWYLSILSKNSFHIFLHFA
jgi:hypothetical protein